MADEADRELQLEQLGEALARPPTLLGARAMLAAASLEANFLVHRRITLGAISLITGEPGAKKSWLAYSLALAAARGEEWLGVPCRQGPALILNYDNSTAECGRRFLRLGMRPEDPVFFHTVEGPEALRLPGAAAELHALIAHVRPIVVVSDSLRQSHTADENSSKEMAEVMAHLKAFYRYGAAIVGVHHSAKGDGAPSRGSGEIDASCDAMIHAVVGEATWKKHRSWNLAPEEETVGFEVTDDGDRTIVRAAPRRPAPEKRSHRRGSAQGAQWRP